MSRSVSIIIPTLNAELYLPSLFEALDIQTCAFREIILIDSWSTDKTREIAQQREKVRVYTINEFSHGGARNMGVHYATGDLIVLMTQDAQPLNEYWLENLLKPLEDEQVAAVFSRQIARDNASPMERFFLETHFPPGAPARMKISETGEARFQQEVFLSNVSAAMRKEILLEYPFDENLIMSEDQQFARDVLNAGYVVVYEPNSAVIHSHKYTLSLVFKRYFDSVYSLRGLFDDHDIRASASIGAKYIFKEWAFIIRFHPFWLPYYFLYNTTKACATVLAHCAEHLPARLLQKMSMHKYYWRKS